MLCVSVRAGLNTYSIRVTDQAFLGTLSSMLGFVRLIFAAFSLHY
jgi:hypothetical protein